MENCNCENFDQKAKLLSAIDDAIAKLEAYRTEVDDNYPNQNEDIQILRKAIATGGIHIVVIDDASW